MNTLGTPVPCSVAWINKFGSRCYQEFPSIVKAKRFAYDTLQFDGNDTYKIERLDPNKIVWEIPRCSLSEYIIILIEIHYEEHCPWLLNPSSWDRID